MAKTVYYVHATNPERRGIVFVTRVRKQGRKQILDCEYMLDPPGAWDETKWNCHVDGCDYQFDTKEEALRCGADVYDYDPRTGTKPGYEFRECSMPYEWQKNNPKEYGI